VPAPTTNRKSSASDPFAVALRLLTGRDRSCAELRRRLLERGFATEAVDDALRRCRDYGYLDDRRYAHSLARQLFASGRAVGTRARLELQQRGLAEELIDEALAAVDAESRQPELLHELLQRRWPGYDDRSADDKQRRRIVAWFQRRGFPLAQIFATLKQTAGTTDDRHDF